MSKLLGGIKAANNTKPLHIIALLLLRTTGDLHNILAVRATELQQPVETDLFLELLSSH